MRLQFSMTVTATRSFASETLRPDIALSDLRYIEVLPEIQVREAGLEVFARLFVPAVGPENGTRPTAHPDGLSDGPDSQATRLLIRLMERICTKGWEC